MNFKRGDKIICVDNTGIPLIKGAVYVVANPYGDSMVRLMECANNSLPYYSSRFKPYIDSQPSGAVVMYPIHTTLPTDSKARKNYPLHAGCLRYFPAALAGVAETSKLGNDKHNPGEELHHARGKSMDHGDCILRHLTDVEDLLAAYNRGQSNITQQQILTEANQMAWRALAFSQELHEKFGAPLAPAAKK